MAEGIKISDSESAVMKLLWACKEPMTERQILDALCEDSEWKPSTIKTFIKRLLDKGAIEREKKEVFHYRAVLKESDFANERTVDLVNTMYGGNAKNLVSALLNQDILTGDDIDDIKNFWQERKKRK